MYNLMRRVAIFCKYVCCDDVLKKKKSIVRVRSQFVICECKLKAAVLKLELIQF